MLNFKHLIDIRGGKRNSSSNINILLQMIRQNDSDFANEGMQQVSNHK